MWEDLNQGHTDLARFIRCLLHCQTRHRKENINSLYFLSLRGLKHSAASLSSLQDKRDKKYIFNIQHCVNFVNESISCHSALRSPADQKLPKAGFAGLCFAC